MSPLPQHPREDPVVLQGCRRQLDALRCLEAAKITLVPLCFPPQPWPPPRRPSWWCTAARPSTGAARTTPPWRSAWAQRGAQVSDAHFWGHRGPLREGGWKAGRGSLGSHPRGNEERLILPVPELARDFQRLKKPPFVPSPTGSVCARRCARTPRHLLAVAFHLSPLQFRKGAENLPGAEPVLDAAEGAPGARPCPFLCLHPIAGSWGRTNDAGLCLSWGSALRFPGTLHPGTRDCLVTPCRELNRANVSLIFIK